MTFRIDSEKELTLNKYKAEIFKGWSGNLWDPQALSESPLHKSYFHNTDILFALCTFILSQIYIGPFQGKLNMILQQTEYKKCISLLLVRC